jgi:hypothetical protein
MGCMDSNACNYDPAVNLNVPGLCCYPGACGGRDIAVVCPELWQSNFEIKMVPNPTDGETQLVANGNFEGQQISWKLYNAFGVVLTTDTGIATENNLKRYHLEPGFQPRMALGFSLTYLVQIFAEFIKKDVASTLKEIAAKVKDTAPYEEEMTRAFEAIKAKVNNKFIIVTDGYFESTGIRFAQQIQENAKHEAFVSVLPEANHNMIESYYGDLPSLYILLNSNSNPRVGARFEFLTNLLEVENHKVINMAVNKFNLEAVYEMIHRLDWLSLYVADYRKLDSLNVPNIASLKEYLSNV